MIHLLDNFNPLVYDNEVTLANGNYRILNTAADIVMLLKITKRTELKYCLVCFSYMNSSSEIIFCIYSWAVNWLTVFGRNETFMECIFRILNLNKFIIYKCIHNEFKNQIIYGYSVI